MAAKHEELLNIIRADPLGCDLKLSFFVSSQIYLYDSCCVPFPPKFIVNKEKNITELAQLIDSIPDFEDILLGRQTLTGDQADLLCWLFVDLKGPTFKTVPKSKFAEILSKTGQEKQSAPPTYMFAVEYHKESPSELKFQEYSCHLPTSYAYHGSKVRNFHNILHHGLQQHLNKNSLFGEGLYLSTELDVSLPYSTNGTGWQKSSLGTTLACVALCEYVDHPVCVKKCTKEAQHKTDLPEKYIIVRNNDIVRVRYLVIYASGRRKQQKAQGLIGLMFNHKFLFVFYFLILVIIGCSDSRYINHLKQKLYRKLSSSIEDVRMFFGNR